MRFILILEQIRRGDFVQVHHRCAHQGGGARHAEEERADQKSEAGRGEEARLSCLHHQCRLAWYGSPCRSFSPEVDPDLGYSDEKVRRLTLSSLEQGFNHFKVRPSPAYSHDLGLRLHHSFSSKWAPIQMTISAAVCSSAPSSTIPRISLKAGKSTPPRLLGRTPGPRDASSWWSPIVRQHLIPCTQQVTSISEVWDVPQAIEYMKKLEPLRPWFIEEPTAPDDVVGHAAIRKALKPHGIGVATGEHAHNRVCPRTCSFSLSR